MVKEEWIETDDTLKIDDKHTYVYYDGDTYVNSVYNDEYYKVEKSNIKSLGTREWYVVDEKLIERINDPEQVENFVPTIWKTTKSDDTCKWTYDDNHFKWDTSCGDSFQFTEGGPKENNIDYCPYCGSKLIVVKTNEINFNIDADAEWWKQFFEYCQNPDDNEDLLYVMGFSDQNELLKFLGKNLK